MSSHHFVKEDQEPALLLTDAFRLSDIENLLEWSPYIVGLPGTLQSLVIHGIHFDALISKSALPDLETRPSDFAHIPADTDDEVLLIKAAFNLFLERGTKHLNVWTRRPAIIMEAATRELFPVSVSVVEETIFWSRINTGKFSKWLPAGAKLLFHGKDLPQVGNASIIDKAITTLQDGQTTVRHDEEFWIGEFRRNNWPA